MSSFLSESNLAGQTLLKLVSRGSSIIAELSRLADNVPGPFLGKGGGGDGGLGERFAALLFDMRYFEEPDMYESRVSRDSRLVELDEELQELFGPLVGRFYTLFEACCRFVEELVQYFEDLRGGFFVSASLESAMLDLDGKQLVAEAVGLWGTILLLLDRRLPGPVRERLVVAHFRFRGEGAVLTIEEVQKLCRSTGYAPGGSRPPNYPDRFFQRFPLPEDVVDAVIGALRSEDIYQMQRAFPLPEHRSAALSQQAALAFCALYFAPRRLAGDRALLREVVARHFPDNWVVHVHLGLTVDLSVEWAPYAAAREVLQSDTVPLKKVRELAKAKAAELVRCDTEVAALLSEGTLSEAYVVEHLKPVLAVLRRCNVSLRWLFLHRASLEKRLRQEVQQHCPPPPALLDFLLKVAQLEFRLKGVLNAVLEGREERWGGARERVEGMLRELSDYFGGLGPLSSAVEKDEGLQRWFSDLADRVGALEAKNPMLAGRKIQRLIDALQEVERFEDVEASTAARENLGLCRQELLGMVRVSNVTEETMGHLASITDLSYAWGLLGEFVPHMHARIRSDASAVGLMRAAFLKLTSVLDVPLTRITQAASKDAFSVAKHYSDKLEAFLRRVLEVIPRIVFSLLAEIAELQRTRLPPMPVKIEAEHLGKLSRLEERFELARRTHAISVFTQGVLAQERTLLGVCSVDPRRILNDGIRQQLVVKVVKALDARLQFDARAMRSREPKHVVEAALKALLQDLTGLRTSLEYIQDYIGIKGLRMWQDEYTRALALYAEQEANLYLRRRTLPRDSSHWNAEVPMPLLRSPPTPNPADATDNFVGRVLWAVRQLSDPASSTYSPRHSGWFEPSGAERAGLGLFVLLEQSLGVAGLAAVDRVASFRIAKVLGTAVKCFHKLIAPGGAKIGREDLLPALKGLHARLYPLERLVPEGDKVLATAATKLAAATQPFAALLLETGQLQLLRRHIAHKLRFSCRLDSNLLHTSLVALNDAVLNDVRRHYHDPASRPYPSHDNPLLPTLVRMLEATGVSDPWSKIYLTCKPQPFLALFLAATMLNELPKLHWDHDFGSLVANRPRDATDGFPLLVGIATLLRQVHPANTAHLLAYLGQHVRTTLHTTLTAESLLRSKRRDVAPETVALILALRLLAAILRLPNDTLYAFVPSYVFEAISVQA